MARRVVLARRVRPSALLVHPAHPGPGAPPGRGVLPRCGAPAFPPGDDAGDGRPAIVARVDGWALEARVWDREPPGVEGAVRHPSGVWIALRFPGVTVAR